MFAVSLRPRRRYCRRALLCSFSRCVFRRQIPHKLSFGCYTGYVGDLRWREGRQCCGRVEAVGLAALWRVW